MKVFTMMTVLINMLGLAAMTSAAAAESGTFYIYRGKSDNQWNSMDAFFVSRPGQDITCDQFGSLVLLWRGDVSGDKYGVACDGDGCKLGNDPKDIGRLEINASNSPGHYTYYKDRNGALVDVGDHSRGSCWPLRDDEHRDLDFDCKWDVNRKHLTGRPILGCRADVW